MGLETGNKLDGEDMNSKHYYLRDMRARRRLCVLDLDLDARLLWVLRTCLRRDLEPPEGEQFRLVMLSEGITWTLNLFFP